MHVELGGIEPNSNWVLEPIPLLPEYLSTTIGIKAFDDRSISITAKSSIDGGEKVVFKMLQVTCYLKIVPRAPGINDPRRLADILLLELDKR